MRVSLLVLLEIVDVLQSRVLVREQLFGPLPDLLLVRLIDSRANRPRLDVVLDVFQPKGIVVVVEELLRVPRVAGVEDALEGSNQLG